MNNGTGSLWKRFWKRIILVVLIAQIAGAVVLINSVEREVEDASGDNDPSFRLATEISVNRRAGYSFRYPPGWSVEQEGAISKSISPFEDVIVAFGFGPPGDLLGAFDELHALILASYEDVWIQWSDLRAIRGQSTAVVSGFATNKSGARLRLRAALIEGENRNYMITAFAEETARVEDLAATLSEIFRSLSAR